jgi:ribosomal protein S14
MKTKLIQVTKRLKYNKYTYLPNLRSRQFIENSCRHLRTCVPQPIARAAMGFARKGIASIYAASPRVAQQSRCFLSTRARGTYQRFSISRLKMRSIIRTGTLFGLRKAS